VLSSTCIMAGTHNIIPREARMAAKPPLDFSHHYSRTAKAREASEIKRFYKFFQIPGIGNLAGGKSYPAS
jgi:hypothetical protein